jgi:serine/threonine protein phosphatase PrpC
MKLSTFSYTSRGGREHNEDSVRCRAGGGRGVFVVADGLGGHQCGEVASALAADALFDGCIQAEILDGDGLAELLCQANGLLLERQGQPGQEGMRTTAAVLVLEKGRAVWAHIGDSRVFHFSGGALSSVTRDHSVTYRKFLGGEISYMDVYHDDDRSSLLRVLGKAECRPEAGGAAAVPGDAFLLCSDGFWEYVYAEEMLIDLAKAESPEHWAKLLLLRHIRRTPPGNDNFSVITVFVEE